MSANASLTRQGRCERFTDKGGFTLIEVLVAFTVMATLLSVLYRGVVVMRSGAIAFDDHTQQDIVARRVFDEALAKRDLVAGIYTGIREGHRWTIVAKLIDLSGQLPPPEPDDTEEKAGASGQAQGVSGQGVSGQAQGVAENGKVAAPAKDDKPKWQTQRLIVRVETKGKPLEIETIRLVNMKRER